MAGRDAERARDDAGGWAAEWRFALGCVAIALVAAAFRFWSLAAAPIWMDEAFTIQAAHLPWRVLLLEGTDLHPPLFYLVEKAWFAVSADPALARVPAALLGVAGVVVLTLATADLATRRAGLFAGAFAAVSTSHIYFSQDARMYPLLLLALTLVLWGVTGLLGGRAAGRYAWLYAIGAVTALYAHIQAPMLLAVVHLGIVATWLVTWWRERRLPGWRALLVTDLVLAVCAVPLTVRTMLLVQGAMAA